jgi:hypothetical protein
MKHISVRTASVVSAVVAACYASAQQSSSPASGATVADCDSSVFQRKNVDVCKRAALDLTRISAGASGAVGKGVPSSPATSTGTPFPDSRMERPAGSKK